MKLPICDSLEDAMMLLQWVDEHTECYICKKPIGKVQRSAYIKGKGSVHEACHKWGREEVEGA